MIVIAVHSRKFKQILKPYLFSSYGIRDITSFLLILRTDSSLLKPYYNMPSCEILFYPDESSPLFEICIKFIFHSLLLTLQEAFCSH